MSAVTIALMFVVMVGLSAFEVWLFWRLGRGPTDSHTESSEVTERGRSPERRAPALRS